MVLGFKTHFPVGKGFIGHQPTDPQRPETNFIPQLDNGRKKTTLREGFRWKVGDVASCYTGVRSKESRFHFSKKVIDVQPVVLFFRKRERSDPFVFINGAQVNGEIRTISQNDGFYLMADFLNWFWLSLDEGHGLFVGQLLAFEELDTLRVDIEQKIPATVINDTIVKMFRNNYQSGKKGREKNRSVNFQLAWRNFLETKL